ncbi:MAG: lipid-binding SYLF domain-containing protein [Alphaproteobacteria bacterium GM202ARS2]|nr:lipid-binding SYLF domain-containing protein [Alphaproteobacteria bacterium GM202ARS2]
MLRRFCPAIPAIIVLVLFAPLGASVGASSARAETFNPSYLDAEEVLQECVIFIKRILNDPENEAMRETLRQAKAIMIFPSILRLGFIFGIKGGRGVMVVRRDSGTISYPAFFDIGAVSLGAQAGVETSSVVFAIMSERGVISLLKERVKLGADLSIAVGPLGTGTSAATTARLADIYSYSDSDGIFLGLSLEGAYINSEVDLNQAFYGKGASAALVLGSRRYKNSAAEDLMKLLSTL